MEYIRIQSIDHPLFRKMYTLMQTVFPKEEVLEYDLWKEPLEDPGIRVFVAVQNGEVVGATEYRYYPALNIGMTDFTIIGKPGLGIGRFLYANRQKDLLALAEAEGKKLRGMFAEIYDPYRIEGHAFGGIKPMDPYVRREVLSHLGYMKLDFPYVHPSWENDGEAVSGLDFCFMLIEEEKTTLETALIVEFLQQYYAVLPNKPQAWLDMIDALKSRDSVDLLPI